MLPISKVRAFTLIELMIALAIVAILASLAVPSYKTYVTRAKLVDAVQGLSAMRADMEGHLQMTGKMPVNLNGIPLQHNANMHGKSTDIVEGYRFDGNGTYFWFVVRLQQDVLDEPNLHWTKREMHFGMTKNAAGNWVSFCGSWDGNNWIDLEKYAPPGCDEPNVYASLRASK